MSSRWGSKVPAHVQDLWSASPAYTQQEKTVLTSKSVASVNLKVGDPTAYGVVTEKKVANGRVYLKFDTGRKLSLKGSERVITLRQKVGK